MRDEPRAGGTSVRGIPTSHSPVSTSDLQIAIAQDPLLRIFMGSSRIEPRYMREISVSVPRADGSFTIGTDRLARFVRRYACTTPDRHSRPASAAEYAVKAVADDVARAVLSPTGGPEGLNSLLATISDAPHSGAVSGIRRRELPEYQNRTAVVPGAFNVNSLSEIRRAVRACQMASAGRGGGGVIISSMSVYHETIAKLDSRDVVYMGTSGSDVLTLCFGGAQWVPLEMYRDLSSCRILTLEDINLHLGACGTTTTSTPNQPPGVDAGIADMNLQFTFQRLSSQASVSGWSL
ncbi:MAG: hypothetical protein K8T20_13185 [Planctomycetes bacterium]|nr:hypothetical protein [Planctomycetota bacterium]